MTIKELIQEYKEERLTGAMFNVESRVTKTLTALSDAMYRDLNSQKEDAPWQIELKEVCDDTTAMLAFYEMSRRKIDQKLSAVLSFYYATKVLKDDYPENLKKTAHAVRATVLFLNNSHFHNYCIAIKNYKGLLGDNEALFNILLLAEYYSAEGETFGRDILDKMTPIAKKVAGFYSEFSKSQVIALGLDASNYLYDFICHCLCNKNFPIACL